MKRLSFAIIALLTCVTPGFTQNLTDGAGAEQRGDYTAALNIYMALADQGDAIAQSFVGNIHANGKGVPVDLALALKWYLILAKNVEAPKQFAQSGIEFAQLQEKIAIMYFQGAGTPQSYEESVKWDRLAAKNGNTQGQFNLGAKYYNGDGVERNFKLAYMWFEISELNEPGRGVKLRNKAGQQLTEADARAAGKAALMCIQTNYEGCQ